MFERGRSKYAAARGSSCGERNEDRRKRKKRTGRKKEKEKRGRGEEHFVASTVKFR